MPSSLVTRIFARAFIEVGWCNNQATSKDWLILKEEKKEHINFERLLVQVVNQIHTFVILDDVDELKQYVIDKSKER